MLSSKDLCDIMPKPVQGTHDDGVTRKMTGKEKHDTSCRPHEVIGKKEDDDEEINGQLSEERVEARKFVILQEGDKRVLYSAGMCADLEDAERLYTLSSHATDCSEDDRTQAELFDLLFGRDMPQEASRAYTMVAKAVASNEPFSPQPAARSFSEPVAKVAFES